MRKLLVTGVIVALVVAILAVADVVVRHTVEHDVASRIEARVPGSAATVHISSWPFVGRLAASGTVPSLTADVTGVKVGPFPVDGVHLAVQDLKVSRSDLVHRKVVIQSIRLASINAVISQQSLDAGSGLPIALGAGTVGVGGIRVPARISVDARRLTISVPALASLTVPLLPAALLPCAASAVITAGIITLSCSTTTIPPALASAVAVGG